MSDLGPEAPQPIVEIPQPMWENPDPDAVIRFTYPKPGSGELEFADDASVRAARRYLEKRHLPGPVERHRQLGLVDTDFVVPVPDVVPAGTEVDRLRKTNRWLIHPAVAIGTWVLSAALINGPSAYNTVDAAIHRVMYQPTPGGERPEYVPGKRIVISRTAASPDRVGSFAVHRGAIEGFVDEVKADEAQGGAVTGLFENVGSSDEYAADGGDNSIGVVSPGDTELDHERDSAVAEVLKADFGGELPAPLHHRLKEHVLSHRLKGQLERLARKFGFPNLISAVQAVDAHKIVNYVLGSAIIKNFTSQRGVTVGAEVDMLGHVTERMVPTPGRNNPPRVPPFDFDGFVPLPWLRRRKWVREAKERTGLALVPWFNLPKPQMLREDKRHEWIDLLKEAELPDGQFQRFAAFYSRKYLHLLRDGRIPQIMRADYRTAPGGPLKSFYTLFVDQAPVPEEGPMPDIVQRVAGELAKFAAMDEGRLADKVPIIAIHPSDQAGKSPDRPQRIGPGIDTQYDEGTLGVTIALLGLAEMHMDRTDDPNYLTRLLEALKDFRKSPVVTLDHEVAGHGGQIINRPIRIRRAKFWRKPNARVPDGEQFEPKIPELEQLLPLPSGASGRTSDPPVEFLIQYEDHSGPHEAQVGVDDPRLTRASKVTIVRHRVSKYAGQEPLENEAEHVAAVTSGLTVPLDEAGSKIKPRSGSRRRRRQFAQGYQPAHEAQYATTESLGGIAGSYPVEFDNPPEVTINIMRPDQDSLMAEFMRMARRRRFPRRRKELISIYAGVANHQHSAEEGDRQAA